jgi:hypothetical protein
MASPSYTQALVDKLRELPDDDLVEVEDFIDFLRHKRQRAVGTLEERLRIAADAGLLTLPDRGKALSSVTDCPPVSIPGRPMSEMALEDRR